ncbi:hypothetical protein LOZ39_002629 [Ophidiomyces ophidiicola]|nr:hypothetical protein LOZ62_002643 [Ophidiomyces ophidiicola]KAI2054016.1 hypothetical protein LOZ38_001545 [Ophidiomyces ophidiicola]KAI2076725.1 hypothetical protein LOZ39_002629 [Ophidiomyces ophidiicola]KAI2090353.1 hypothetical protein LOZ35_005249 [Ophidiomyces ophidiicola]KAI2107123.1 hypothetical protein LOZ34_002891 [Ophidiomyces ophidiicola]
MLPPGAVLFFFSPTSDLSNGAKAWGHLDTDANEEALQLSMMTLSIRWQRVEIAKNNHRNSKGDVGHRNSPEQTQVVEAPREARMPELCLTARHHDQTARIQPAEDFGAGLSVLPREEDQVRYPTPQLQLVHHPEKGMPSTAIVNALQNEKKALEDVLLLLKRASPDEVPGILESVPIVNGNVVLRRHSPTPAVSDEKKLARPETGHPSDDDGAGISSDEDLDVLPFLSIDEGGKVDSFGPSSALQGPTKPILPTELPVAEHVRNQLIANAILQRQREHDLCYRQDIFGVPMELAKHLLDLHWNRQHHTFLLTYRPAIMRDLVQSGPYCSEFLITAIFACSSKYSQRIEVRDNPVDPTSSGRRFFARCGQLLAERSLLNSSSIATLVGLLLLGSTYNARGDTSKGWLYTGYALRMVYDLGLHLDYKATTANAEDIEIRRRVFWGAFICDKLQSLYLGRPMTIHLRDVHVSRNFMDTMEEKELWTPYVDPLIPAENMAGIPRNPTPIHSVSTFQQLCLLSRIMTKIINRFYVVGATAADARASLQSIDDALISWKDSLPTDLKFEPWSDNPIAQQARPAPNVMILSALYHSLVILLHRPFISDGHLRSAVPPASSWKRCSTAARNITSIVVAYQATYTLRGAPYLMSYAVYVACTIHVRNAAATERDQPAENSSLLSTSLHSLDELSLPNVGISKPASIIRNIMATNGIKLVSGMAPILTPSSYRIPRINIKFQEPRGVDIHSPSSLDLDAILRMFPSRSPIPEGLEQPTTFGPGFSLSNDPYAPEDLLYGFMNGETPSFTDFTADGVFRM